MSGCADLPVKTFAPYGFLAPVFNRRFLLRIAGEPPLAIHLAVGVGGLHSRQHLR